jgi:hypothetical protein
MRCSTSIRLSFGGEAEMGRVAVQGSEFTSLGDLDRVVELIGLEQLGPETLGERADRLNLDPGPTGLGGQNTDGLRPVRTFEYGALSKLSQNLICIHEDFAHLPHIQVTLTTPIYYT